MSPKNIKKQLQMFMTVVDEEEFSNRLISVRRSVVFIDGGIWDTKDPPTKSSVDLCNSNHVYLWDSEMVGVFVPMPRKDGRFEGPKSGPVVQFSRSIQTDSVLMSGRLASGVFDTDLDYISFRDAVWRVLKGMTTTRLVAVAPWDRHIINPKVPGFVVGNDAAKWCAADDHLLKGRSTENYFLPAELAIEGKQT